MPVRCSVRVGEYHDSITLMQTAQQLTRLPGVADAAVVMGTAANKALLQAAGLWTPEMVPATPNDLLIVVKAQTEELLQSALAAAEANLTANRGAPVTGAAVQPRTLRTAVRSRPESNVAVISVAGQYAAGEAWEALKSGLNVLLFSDNVALEDEIALKQYAVAHGLLLMGPGCGTAILNGVALGFANVVPRGPVGIVAAAGTGLQEVSSLLARLGVGVSQGIGTGGRDLHEEVGALTMLQGLQGLQGDSETEVIVLISKPPSPAVAARVLEQVKRGDKPAVVCFLGHHEIPGAGRKISWAGTLQWAAYLAAGLATGQGEAMGRRLRKREMRRLEGQGLQAKGTLGPGQKYLRGLFSGGTLQAEALVVWRSYLEEVRSNSPLEPQFRLADSMHSVGHCALDLGEEEFTVGRPHPMIDNDLRIRRLLREAADPEVAVIVLDLVLGYGAHPDPASELGPAIQRAREAATAQGRELVVVTSVTGTDGDPQGLQKQERALEAAGATVCSCNAAAAELAALIVGGSLRVAADRVRRAMPAPGAHS